MLQARDAYDIRIAETFTKSAWGMRETWECHLMS